MAEATSQRKEKKEKKKKAIVEQIEIPEKVEVRIEEGTVFAKGQKGELSRRFPTQQIKIRKEDNKIIIQTEKASKREKKLIYTIIAHINNIIKGVQEGYVYILTICSSHFPIKASVAGDKFEVKNFLGERKPRIVNIRKGVKITVDGNTVIVEGIDKEIVSQQAADIEQLCIIKNRDRRIFQDGIYITEKAGKSML